MSIRLPLAATVLVLLLVGTSQPVAAGTASAPPNDDLHDAETIEGPLPHTSTVELAAAGAEESEPNCGDTPIHTVWYRFTAPQTLHYEVLTSGPPHDVSLCIFDADLQMRGGTSLGPVHFGFDARRGDTYFLQLGANEPPAGPITFAVRKAEGIADACPPGRSAPVYFRDIDMSQPHFEAIACMVAWGITHGRAATEYAPAADVSRAQMASLLARLLEEVGNALPVEPTDAFPDDTGSVHETNINRLASVDLIRGFSERRYGPDRPVTRAQMASLIVRVYDHLAGSPLPEGGDGFPDDDGNAHEAAIDRATGAGLIRGRDDGTFGPAVPVQRDQAASLLARLLDKLIEDEEATLPAPPVPFVALPTLGGAEVTPRDINDAGQIVGMALTASGEARAFLYEDGTITDLGAPLGFSSDARAVNERGQVVGVLHDDDDPNRTRAFLWEDGEMTDVGTLGGDTASASDINDAGQIVGSSATSSGNHHAFVWEEGEMVDLGVPPGAVASFADGINDRGDIVGSLSLPDEHSAAFLWQEGHFTKLGTLGGDYGSARDVNESGVVVGTSEPSPGRPWHGFRWEDGVMTDLGPADGASDAVQINDRGEAVGQLSRGYLVSSRVAAVWQDGRVLPLSDYSSFASGVNASGQVVGTTRAVETRGVLWK